MGVSVGACRPFFVFVRERHFVRGLRGVKKDGRIVFWGGCPSGLVSGKDSAVGGVVDRTGVPVSLGGARQFGSYGVSGVKADFFRPFFDHFVFEDVERGCRVAF